MKVIIEWEIVDYPQISTEIIVPTITAASILVDGDKEQVSKSCEDISNLYRLLPGEGAGNSVYTITPNNY